MTTITITTEDKHLVQVITLLTKIMSPNTKIITAEKGQWPDLTFGDIIEYNGVKWMYSCIVERKRAMCFRIDLLTSPEGGDVYPGYFETNDTSGMKFPD